MKKSAAMILSLLMMVGLLSACGGTDAETEGVVLEDVLTQMEETCQWTEDYLGTIEGELLENYYPGIGEIETKQFIAKAPMMSSVVNEIVMAECQNEKDADQVYEILEQRVAYQVGDEENHGGAFYPASIAVWETAEVLRHENFVALIVSESNQSELVDLFNGLFE